MENDGEKKGEDRDESGRFIKGHTVRGGKNEKDKDALRKSLAKIYGLPENNPVVNLLVDLGTSKDKKIQAKAVELFAKRIEPKKEEPEALDPTVIELMSLITKLGGLEGMREMVKICPECDKFPGIDIDLELYKVRPKENDPEDEEDE